jgi:hypothetical protein
MFDGQVNTESLTNVKTTMKKSQSLTYLEVHCKDENSSDKVSEFWKILTVECLKKSMNFIVWLSTSETGGIGYQRR